MKNCRLCGKKDETDIFTGLCKICQINEEYLVAEQEQEYYGYSEGDE